jgi:hypothetical protein
MKGRGAVVAVGPERRDRGATVVVGEWECTRWFWFCEACWLTSFSSTVMCVLVTAMRWVSVVWYYSLVWSSSV